MSSSALPLVQWRFSLGVMRSYASGRHMSRLAVQQYRSMRGWRGVHVHDRGRSFPRVGVQLAAFVAAAITATLASAISAAVAAVSPADVTHTTAANAFAAVSTS
jgi:hypothetical protein